MEMENRLSRLLQLYIHSLFNTWLQQVVQRQLWDTTSNIYVLWFDAAYIRGLIVFVS